MKRYLLFLATVALLASCKRSEEPGDENTKDQMRFTANVPAKEDNWQSPTRGQVTDNNSIAHFGVFCFNTGRTEWSTAAATALPNKMYDVEVARATATSDWAYNPPIEWMGGDGSLFTFFGYSPRAMGLYEAANNVQGNNIEMSSKATDAGVPALRFTTLEDIPMQIDLLMAKPVIDTRPMEKVQMQFAHALSQIRFKAWAVPAFVRVKSIEISNISHTATIALDGTITPESGTKTFLLGNINLSLSTDVAKPTDLSDGGNGFMLLPQDLSGNSTAQITVTYEVAGETKTSKPYTIVENWEANQSYTYILSLGGDPTEDMVVTEVKITDWAIDSEDNLTTSPPPSFIEIDGLRWATGNLVANGANGAKIGAPGDGGLYFQYGGLIGYKGGATGDGTGITDATKHSNGKFWGGTDTYSADEVVVAPAGYTNQATWPIFRNDVSNGFGYYYFHDFAEKYKDFQSQPNANQPDLGIGDPCAYYLGGEWRLPKYDELSAITGSATENAWVPWNTAGVTGRWEKTDGPQSTMGAWFGPTAKTNPTVNTDLFIPTSGLRNYSDGAFYYVGIEGFLWSSSVSDNFLGFCLGTHESRGVYPRYAYFRALALPVRCVSGTYVASHKPTPPTEDQTIEIHGLKWTTGNLVAKDAANCKVGAVGDNGLYFQYGGLIGYKGGANGDGVGVINGTTHTDGKWWNGAAAYSADDVAVAPVTYTNQATWPTPSSGFGYYYFSDFTERYADFQSRSNSLDPANGIGDPCAYYLGGEWRLPKHNELSSITGSDVEGTVSWSDVTITGKWTNVGPQSKGGSWFGPTAKTNPNANTDLFIPASGYRNPDRGTFEVVNGISILWGSSVYNDTRGFAMQGHSTNDVKPRDQQLRARGFPIRCVSGTYVAPYKPTPPTQDQIVEIDGLKWTTGNLVATDASNAKVGAPGDGGLYFQYGGLIGYKGGANGDGTGITNATTHSDGKYWGGAAAYSANDVAVKPAAYANQGAWPYHNNVASGGFGYYYFNDFVTKYADFQGQTGDNNPTLGIGDPCAYYLGSPWRLPKYNELSAITGSAVAGSWVSWTTAGVTGKWTSSGPQSTMGAWFGPNSRSGTPTVNTDLFIPATGRRNVSNGSFSSVGTLGYLWSSSVYEADGGFRLLINESSGVHPRHWLYRASGLPVRCVSGTLIPTVEVKGTKWATGNLVANGANGAKIGKPGDGGLYFQYGGLIGYKGGANGDGTGITSSTLEGKCWGGALNYSANDVVIAPTGYGWKGSWPKHFDKSSGGYGYYYYNNFTNVHGNFQTQGNANSPGNGIGDPCAYYLGGEWRLPTYKELSDITGSAVEGSAVDWGIPSVTGKWIAAGPQSAPGAWFGPNSRTGTPTVNTDLFIPASGIRDHNSGIFLFIGTSGNLWSSSIKDGSMGYFLNINQSNGVQPLASITRARGYPVRCVKK